MLTTQPLWVLGLSVLFAFGPVSVMIQSNLPSAFLMLVCLIIGLAWLARKWRPVDNRRFLLRLAGLCVVAAILVAITAAASAAADFGEIAGRVAKLLGVAAMAALVFEAAAAASVDRQGGRLLYLAASVGICLLALGILEDLLIGYVRGAPALILDQTGWENFTKRPLTILVALVFPLLLGLAGKSRSAAYIRSAGLAGLTLSVAAVAVSEHEAAVFGLLAGALAALLAWWFPKTVHWLAVAVIGFVMFATPLLPVQAWRPWLLEQTQTFPSLQHRLLIWDFAIRKIDERPVLGWGLDAARDMPEGKALVADRLTAEGADIGQLAPSVAEWAQNLPLHPHNAALQVRLELGLPGALLFFGGLCWAALRLVRTVRPVAATAAGLLVSVATVWMISYGAWQTWWLSMVILAVAGTMLLRRAISQD